MVDLAGIDQTTLKPAAINQVGAIILRPARPGDGPAVFEVTRQSVAGLAADCYDPAQIAGWMGERTPAFYEELIAKGRMTVADVEGVVVGFVDAEPGELTRLFILPAVAGQGLGRLLLERGLSAAREGATGPIKVEATLNAEGFYRHHGFRVTGHGHFSHGLGGAPIAIVQMEL